MNNLFPSLTYLISQAFQLPVWDTHYKNMDLSIRLWKAGMQGAVDLRSEQRFGEALTAYDIMQALWPGDKRIKELRDLTKHW